MCSSCMYIIPHREIVAGVLELRFSASIKILMDGESLIVSPVLSVNFLLSSRTELRFSTQTGSIGPSKTIHFLLLETSIDHCRIK